MKNVFASLLLVFVTSCQAALYGTTEKFSINSTPGNAKVIINGKESGHTPLSIELSKCFDYDVIFEKAGYDEGYVKISKTYNPNGLLFAALYGPFVAIDDGNCSSIRFYNKNIRVDLVKSNFKKLN